MKRLLYITLALFMLALVAGPALAQKTTAKPPATVILKGYPGGGVKLDHATHVTRSGGDKKCVTCHHAELPGSPAGVKSDKCQDCHTRTVKAPMKTNTVAAFHTNMSAKKGYCVDCHIAQKKGPTKCVDCHKKENI